MHSQCVALALLYAATQIPIGSNQTVQGMPDVQTQRNVSSSHIQVQTEIPDLKRSRPTEKSGTHGYIDGGSSPSSAVPHAEKQVTATASRALAKPRAKSTSIAKLMWQCTKVTASTQIRK